MEVKGVVAASQPHWIPVTERLPEPGVMVLVFDIDEDIGIDYRQTRYTWSCYSECEVTHWMPLPAPPKAGD